jgi:hypothetical protein
MMLHGLSIYTTRGADLCHFSGQEDDRHLPTATLASIYLLFVYLYLNRTDSRI